MESIRRDITRDIGVDEQDSVVECGREARWRRDCSFRLIGWENLRRAG